MLKKISLFFLILLSCSCTRTIYQERDIYHHDSIFVTAVAVDTIIQHDSIHTFQKGDTLTTTIYKYIYKVKERTDTCYIERTDTFTSYITRVEPQIVRKCNWLSLLGAFFLGMIFFAIFIFSRRIFFH